MSVARKIAKVSFPELAVHDRRHPRQRRHPTVGPLGDAIGIPEYRPIDLLYTVAGIALTYGTVYPQLEAGGIDLAEQVPDLKVPVYFTEGRWDLNARPPTPAATGTRPGAE